MRNWCRMPIFSITMATFFHIGAGTTIGPLGRLDEYDNMKDVTLAAQDWNEGKLRGDGGMDVRG